MRYNMRSCYFNYLSIRIILLSSIYMISNDNKQWLELMLCNNEQGRSILECNNEQLISKW